MTLSRGVTVTAWVDLFDLIGGKTGITGQENSHERCTANRRNDHLDAH